MSLRYLRAHKIIYFSIAGVAIGIMVMIVVTSIMSGFSRDIRSRIRGMQSHLVVVPVTQDLFIKDYKEICDEIEKIPNVEGCAPRIEWAAWVAHKGTYRTIHIVGIDPGRERGHSDLEKFFHQGGKRGFDFRSDSGMEPASPGVVTGSEFPSTPMLDLRLSTVRQRTDGPLYRNQPFEVVGHFKSGMAEYDAHYLFMDIASAQEFLKLNEPRPVVNQLSITIRDSEKNMREVRRQVIERIHARYPCRTPENHERGRCYLYQTQSWEEAKAILLQAVSVEKGIQIIVLFFIVIVAGFNILAIYTLVVRSKVRDIGILRALGATEGGITTVFLLSGMFCGLVGSLIGIGAGLAFSFNANEIADFVEVSSREFNHLAQGPKVLAETVLWAGVSALILYWCLFYNRDRNLLWLGPLAGALCGLGTWLFLAWAAPKEDALGPPDFNPRLRLILAAVAAGLPIIAEVQRHFLRKLPGDGLWGPFSFITTLLFAPLLVFVLGLKAISSSILSMKPRANWRGLELFPKDVYYLDRIPVYVDTNTIALIVAFTLVVSLICSVYPARKAASYDPIEAIRDE